MDTSDQRVADRIESDKKKVAAILNKLETIRDDFEWIFEMKPEWYDGVKDYISKAAIELGYCLATLEGWYDDEDSTEEIVNKKE